MFASKSLVEHLARGIVGIGAVTASVPRACLDGSCALPDAKDRSEV